MWCQDLESAPLLANSGVQEDDKKGRFNLFSFFCFLSGQYINVSSTRKGPSRCNIIFAAGFALFLCQLFLHLSHFIIAMIVESYRINAIISYAAINKTVHVQCTALPQNDWKFSSAVTFGTFAALVSYCFFTLVVILLNSSLCCCYHSRSEILSKDTKAFQGLSPFDNSTNYSAVNFWCDYFYEHVFLVIGFISFIAYPLAVYYYELGQHLNTCLINILDIARFFLYFNSQFCAIQRCFMFFKIVDKINFKLSKLTEDFDQVDFPEHSHNVYVQDDKMIHELIESKDKEKVDKGRYYWLQKIDQEFIHHVQPTLALLGVWFIFHWILYTITTALASAALLENIVTFVMFNFRSGGISVLYGQLLLFSSILFTLIHLTLLVYPLFHAASIATARSNMIDTVSKKLWLNIPLSVQSSFVQYLSSKKFAFKVSIFGAQVTVDTKWIYLTFLLIIVLALLY